MDFNAAATPQNEQEANALIEHLQSPSETTEQIEGAAPQAQEVKDEQPTIEELFEIKYRGQTEKHPRAKLLEFAQKGRDYEEKMRAMKVDRASWDSERARYAKLDERIRAYSEIEAYQQKDPAWWDHVTKSYQAKMREQGQAPPALPPEVLADIKDVKEYVTTERQAREDQALDADIKSYREKYPDFEWTQADDQGRDLERQIIDHAIANKIQSFKAAANDYLHDKIVERAQLKAKEDVGKEIKEKAKLGLGPVTTRPTLGIKRAQNVADKSYEQLAEEAMAEFGIA